jgi:hypothetical protein
MPGKLPGMLFSRLKDQAFSALDRRLLAFHEWSFSKSDLFWRNTMSDPRYIGLFRRMGLSRWTSDIPILKEAKTEYAKLQKQLSLHDVSAYVSTGGIC